MHKLECSPMVVFGENWNPSETVRLTARILAKQVRNWDQVQMCLIFFFEVRKMSEGPVVIISRSAFWDRLSHHLSQR